MPSNRKNVDNTKDPSDTLADLAVELNLTAIADQLPQLLAQAEEQAPSFSQFVHQFLSIELNTRKDRKLARNLKRSGLPKQVKSLDSFDFSIRPKIDPRVVREQLNCRWLLDGGRNIICLGRPGLGKTHVLDALGNAACIQGHRVRKVQTFDMLEEIHASQVDGTYQRTLRRYIKVPVLILDDFGYLPLDTFATNHLFRLVSARHRQRPTLIASNTGFKSWRNFFPSEAQAVATIDRLIDRAIILRFTGKGVRKPDIITGAELDEDEQ
jgi:DNA replication protein DnaC